MCKNLEEGVDQGVVLSAYYVTQTAACLHVIHPPLLLLTARCDVDAMFACAMLHHELYNSADVYLGEIDFRMYFLVNALVTSASKSNNIFRHLEGKDKLIYTQVCKHAIKSKQTRIIKNLKFRK